MKFTVTLDAADLPNEVISALRNKAVSECEPYFSKANGGSIRICHSDVHDSLWPRGLSIAEAIEELKDDPDAAEAILAAFQTGIPRLQAIIDKWRARDHSHSS